MDLDTESAELNSSALGCKVGNDTALVRYNFGTGSKIIVPMQDFGVEELVFRFGIRAFGVPGSFSLCAFASFAW